MPSGLTDGEITRIVNRYIGVSGGYLGDFSYRTHVDFYGSPAPSVGHLSRENAEHAAWENGYSTSARARKASAKGRRSRGRPRVPPDP